MSFKDLKEYLSDNHTSNRVIDPKAGGEYKPAPNLDSGKAVDVSEYGTPGDKHTPNRAFNPKAGGKYEPAPNFEELGDDGM